MSFTEQVLFWSSVYQQTNIKVVLNTTCVDFEKLAKFQALENLNGFYCVSHWSAFLFPQLSIRRYGHVLLTWGEFYSKSFFSEKQDWQVYHVGYLGDFTFSRLEEQSQLIRKELEEDYAICWFDSHPVKDLYFSEKMTEEIYDLFIDILQTYPNTKILIKPKKESGRQRILNHPKLKGWIEKDRVRIYYSQRPKILQPCLVSMASNLVIGEHINTAALEGIFANTPAFMANFSHVHDNDWVQKAKNFIVYNDSSSLKAGVEEMILSKNNDKLKEMKKFLKYLDPLSRWKFI